MNGCLQDPTSLLIPSAAHASQASAAYFLWPPTCSRVWRKPEARAFGYQIFFLCVCVIIASTRIFVRTKGEGQRETSAARRALSEIRHHIYVKTNSPFNQMLVPLTHDYVKRDKFGTAFFQQHYFLISIQVKKLLFFKNLKNLTPGLQIFFPIAARWGNSTIVSMQHERHGVIRDKTINFVLCFTHTHIHIYAEAKAAAAAIEQK